MSYHINVELSEVEMNQVRVAIRAQMVTYDRWAKEQNCEYEADVETLFASYQKFGGTASREHILKAIYE